MSLLSSVQVLRSYFLFSMVGFAFIRLCDTAHATSCQVYPSEYAYHDDSVDRVESTSASANCRRYPAGRLEGGVHPEHYIHCDGTQLKLADSNFGQEQYQSTDYYVWSSRSGEQLLFIFPTRVSLTTITLHYYSDSVRSLPRLRFYAVPDDFGVWDVPTTSYPQVSVAASVSPGREPAGRRNVSINVNFNTRKVVMYKYGSTFVFAVSEVEFFTCNSAFTFTTTEAIATTTQWTFVPGPTITPPPPPPPLPTTTGSTENGSFKIQSSSSSNRFSEIAAWVLVVILLVLLIGSLVINVMQAVWAHRRSCNRNQNTSPEGTVTMASNPCYEASVVKLYVGSEAMRVYENFKPHLWLLIRMMAQEGHSRLHISHSNPRSPKCEDTCCSGTKSPPWFSVQLSTHTTDRIEVNENLC